MMRMNAIEGRSVVVVAWAVATVFVPSPSTTADAQEQPSPSNIDLELNRLEENSFDDELDQSDSSLDRALQSLPSASDDIARYQSGPVTFRLTDLSVDLLFAVGSSTERDSSLGSLQGGGHDPRKRGFTLQNLELSLLGAVDPFFTAEAHLIYFIDPIEGESVLELEEAFLTTQQLPFGLEEYGLELEIGQMFTEFGRINPRHPHAWDWLDQPVINSRVFGPDGMRGPGARIGWLTPLPWFSQFHFGLQNANGETMASFLASDEFFEDRAVGGIEFQDQDVRSLGDLVWLGRWENAWDVSDEVSTSVGLSGLVGPNASGSGGRTVIYGGDFLLKWQPIDNDRGWPFVSWQSEIMRRDYKIDGQATDLPGEDLGDWGLYTQLLWGFLRDWSAGLRYEFVSGDGPSVGGRSMDPFRDERQRLSPVIVWTPTHFSRVRLQYNFDQADHLADDAHSVWLGFEVLIGKHPAHSM